MTATPLVRDTVETPATVSRPRRTRSEPPVGAGAGGCDMSDFGVVGVPEIALLEPSEQLGF
jgi:hypothetical protein